MIDTDNNDISIQIGDVYRKVIENYWVVKYKVVGYNGSCCPWVNESWHWLNGELFKSFPRSLNSEETEKMLSACEKI